MKAKGFSIRDRAGAVSRGPVRRMSTKHQQYSPENQLEIIRQYAAVHNMEIMSSSVLRTLKRSMAAEYSRECVPRVRPGESPSEGARATAQVRAFHFPARCCCT